ncbi:hypothetical protein MCEREM21A_02222 [Sphingomonadaceae bacterium]
MKVVGDESLALQFGLEIEYGGERVSLGPVKLPANWLHRQRWAHLAARTFFTSTRHSIEFSRRRMVMHVVVAVG